MNVGGKCYFYVRNDEKLSSKAERYCENKLKARNLSMKREDVTKVFADATEEQINTLLNINSADIGHAKQKIEAERDSYKSQLDTAKETLKGFEGVDVAQLQGEITKLNTDLANKDAEYQKKIADMEFSSVLDSAINGSKAKNSKAVKALLDLDKLKASKNQTEDIKTALEELRKSDSYLFGSDEPVLNPIGDTSGNNNSGGASSLAAVRAAMGLPPEK